MTIKLRGKTVFEGTNQELFDKVAKAIMEQGRPSYNYAHNSCKYRHETLEYGVLKCAAGHLIPDGLYDEDLEGCAVLGAGFLSDDDQVQFLRHLQIAHDEAAVGSDKSYEHDAEHRLLVFKKRWVDKMQSVARSYELNSDVLKEWETELV